MESSCSANEITTRLYKRRWFFLGLLTLLALPNGASFSMFGQISYFFVSYFDVTYAQVDWMTTSSNACPLILTVPLSWLAFKRILGFRLMSVMAAVTTTIGFLCFAISMVDRSLFALAIVGQTVLGLPDQLILTTPSIFACLWFPENEVGTAIGVNAMGIYAGFALGVLVPATLLTQQHSGNLTLFEKRKVLEDDKFSLIWVYCTCAAVAVVISILFFVFVTDVPPSPPTIAQKSKQVANNSKNKMTSAIFWSQAKAAFSNRTFLFAIVIFAIEYQSNTVEFTMLSQIVREVSVKHHLGLNAPLVGSIAVCCYAGGSAVGTVLAGKLVDNYKRYDLLSIISTFFVFLSSVAILLSTVIVRGLTVLLYTGNVLVGVVSQIALVTLYDVTTQQTFPTDEIVVTLWLTGIVQPAAIVYAEIGRVIYGPFRGIGVLAFQAASYLCGFLFCFLLTPVYGRLEVGDERHCTEMTRLVPSDEENDNQMKHS